MGIVVFATDKADRDDAARRSAVKASNLVDGPLHLITAHEPIPAVVGAPESMTAALDAWVETLRGRAKAVRACLDAGKQQIGSQAKAGCEVHLEDGRASDVIAEYARQHDAELIVVGPHARGEDSGILGNVLERFVGSTAQRVVRVAPCPVLVAGPGELSTDGGVWVVGVDLSAHSTRVLEVAARLAKAAGATLRVVYVHSPTGVDETVHEDANKSWVSEIRRHAAESAQKELVGWLAAQGDRGGLSIDPVIRHGHPVDVLLEESEGAQAIVLGTHGRSGAGRMFLGSVAERVLRRSGIPTVVVPGQ